MKKLLITLLPALFLISCEQNKSNTSPVTEPPNDSATTSQAGLFKPANVNEQILYSRAINVVIWGMPAVNTELLYQGLVNSKGDYNKVVYWSKLPNWKNQTLTPNPETVYLFPFYNTKDGPIVMEIPAAVGGSITGSVDDAWQTAIEDVGPAGMDKGKGGKYLILPPDYKGKIPQGYILMPSPTLTGFAILRSNLASGSDEDVAKAVDYGKRVKIYPLSKATTPPATTFVDAIDVLYDNTIPYDLHFFEILNSFIQKERWLTRDKAMIDQLKSIGIEKGKPFQPNTRTKEILNAAISATHAWMDNEYEKLFSPAYFEGTHWALPVLPEVIKSISTNFADPDSYPIDGRGVTYSMAYFSAKHLGQGQFYLMSIQDKDGNSMDGSKTYSLHIPANAPVKLYWSATIYNRKTHALIRNMNSFSRSSHTPGLQKNTDGSVDIYFGPKASDGKKSNWIPTDANEEFEVLFRFYGPEKPLFDKTWKMGDIEQVK